MGARIRAFDWHAHPLGLPDHWPALLCSTLELVLASPMPACVVWGRGRSMLCNDACEELLKGWAGAALGRDFCAVWSDAWGLPREKVERLAQRARAGEPLLQEDELLFRQEGEGRATALCLSYCISPVRDEAGLVQGWVLFVL